MVEEKILEAVKKARESEKKRNFKQGFDLAINLKNIDLKKPENRVKTELTLPHNPGRKKKVGVIVDSLLPQASGLENVVVIKKSELEKMNKKSARGIAKQCSYFIAEAPLMPLVGKNMGPMLAPRNLMPMPIAPTADLKSNVQSRMSMLKIQLKNSAAVHLGVGSEDMKDEEIAENIEAVSKAIVNILPKNRRLLILKN